MITSSIQRIHAREVLDSRGQPTVEVEVYCAAAAWGRAIVPSGASTGRHEAVELRDGDPARYGGKGVRRAVANVRETIAPRLVGQPVTEQQAHRRDTVSSSTARRTSRAWAPTPSSAYRWPAPMPPPRCAQVPLWQYLDHDGLARMPLPMVNLISGGLHAGGNLDCRISCCCRSAPALTPRRWR